MSTENKDKPSVVPKQGPGKSARERQLLSKPHDAFFVCAPEFLPLILGQICLPQNPPEKGAPAEDTTLLSQRHFLPPSVPLSGLKFRELIERVQKISAAQNVWWEVSHKRVTDLRSVRSALDAVPWQEWFPEKSTLRFSAECQRSQVRQAAQVRAAAETASGSEPAQQAPASGGSEQGVIPIKISLFRDTLRVYAPLTMAPLHHRAYKFCLKHPAGLREDLAQGMILSLASQMRLRGFQPELGRGFDTDQTSTAGAPPEPQNRRLKLLLPFSGTGTFAFEAATLFWELSHCLIGRYDLVRQSPCAPQATLAHIQGKSGADAVRMFALRSVEVFGCDIHDGALSQSRATEEAFLHHLRNMTGAHDIPWQSDWAHADFFDLKPSDMRKVISETTPGPLVCLLNPPFGLRLRVSAAPAFFSRIARKLDLLAQEFPEGMAGSVLCPDPTCAQAFAGRLMQPRWETRVFPLSYGGLKARVVEFFSRSAL